MAWPASQIGITNVDAGTDSPAAARAQIKEAIDAINLLYGIGASAYVGFNGVGSGSVPRSSQDKHREIPSTADKGFLGDGTLADKARFQAAVDACPVGGRLLVPSTGSDLLLYTNGGLSAAVLIDKRMTLIIEGTIKGTFGTQQANPPYLFKVTGNDVTFCGGGTLKGNGTIDDTNTGTELTMPGLVYVTGNRFAMDNLTIDTPPKLGVMLMNCYNARISGNNFIGGPITYTTGNTAYFGVRMYLGSHHVIAGNHFSASSTGGKYINCIFCESTNYCLIANNTANGVYEKLSYLYGNYNRVIGNEVNDTTITDAFRFSGSYNKLIGNHATGVMGGTQVFDGVFNEISHNTFIGCKQIGINVARSSGSYSGGFSGTKITGNIITGGIGTKTDGIRVAADGANSYDINVSSNTVSNFTSASFEGLIKVYAVSPYSLINTLIANNIIDSGLNGIVAQRMVDSTISTNMSNITVNVGILISGSARVGINNNRLTSPGSYAFDLQDSSAIAVLNNQSRNAVNNGILAIGNVNCYGRGNQYGDVPLVGGLQLGATIATTVTHGGVAPGARIFLQEANTAAGLAARVFTVQNGVDFTVTTANGSAAAGTEQFFYEIVQ